jgi:hypothetical protein
MTAEHSPKSSVVLAAVLIGAAAASWQWFAHVRGSPQLAVATGDSWDHVKQSYPAVTAPVDPPRLPPATVEAVISSNLFAPHRFAEPVGASGTATGAGDGGFMPQTPQFIYKGRVQLGNRQRAVMEDSAAKKTYFLEVGQEVAGFKVLDIAENQVVLSDPQSHQEVVVSLALPGGQKREKDIETP